MNTSQPREFDPKLDLVVAREVRVSAEVAWAAWTRPEHLRRWYAPRPDMVSECDIDLRPGGVFRFVVRTTDGTEHQTTCCYLEIVPVERLVWTDALLPGYRPAPAGVFTAAMALEQRGNTTMCTTIAMHRSQSDHDHHAAMGFHDGWGTVLNQLDTYAPSM